MNEIEEWIPLEDIEIKIRNNIKIVGMMEDCPERDSLYQKTMKMLLDERQKIIDRYS